MICLDHFTRLAHVALPEGYKRYDGQPLADGVAVIHIQLEQPLKKTLTPHWYNSYEGNVFLVKFHTHISKGGGWYSYKRIKKKEGGTKMEWTLDPWKRTIYDFCIVSDEDGGALPPPPLPPLEGAAAEDLFVFCSGLYGPPGIFAQAQTLALRLIGDRGKLVAFDTVGGTQGFFGIHSWAHFCEHILERAPSHLRNFYEHIPKYALVRFYLDFDCKLSAFKNVFDKGKSALLALILSCIQEAWQKHYPQQASPLLPMRYLDSSNEAKISLHLLSEGRFFWQNSAAVKSFVRRVRTLLFQRLGLNEAQYDECALVDLSVYKSNQKFRTWRSCKREEPDRVLVAQPGWKCTWDDTLVCLQEAQPLAGDVILQSLAAPLPIPESEFLTFDPRLVKFLKQYEVPIGSPDHNLRWTRTVTDHLFNVPLGDKMDELYRLMAECHDDNKPYHFNAVPRAGIYRRVVVDVDGIAEGVPLDLVADTLRKSMDMPGIACHVLESPPKKIGFRYVHLVFECKALGQVRFDGCCPKEWNIDNAYSALRDAWSDKIVQATGQLAQRELKYVGTCFGNALESKEEIFIKCSLLAGLEELPVVASAASAAAPAAAGASADLTSQEMALLTSEASVLDSSSKVSGIRIYKRSIHVNTTCRHCLCGRQHKSNTQKMILYQNGFKQQPWDEECKHLVRFWPFQNVEGMRALMERVLPPLGAAGHFHTLRSHIVKAFPDDAQIWQNAVDVWFAGDYFGPICQNNHAIDYRIGLFSVLRRFKKSPVEVAKVDTLLFVDPTIVFDHALALSVLNVCKKEFGFYGLLTLDNMTLFGGKGKEILKFDTLLITTLDTLARRKAPKRVAAVCKAFQSSIRLLPLDPVALAQPDIEAWNTLFPGQVTVDHGPSDADIDMSLLPADRPKCLIIVAPPASGKTKAVRKTQFKGDIITSNRPLARSLARDFDTAYYMDGEHTRSEYDLHHEPRPLTAVINTSFKLMDRAVDGIFMDESTACFTAEAGGTMEDSGAQVLESTIYNLAPPEKNVILASADARPQLEGHFVKHILKRPAHVLYKVRGRTAAGTRCIELRNDREGWAALVRLYLYNAKRPKEEWKRAFIASSTAAAVEKARYLCMKYWPEGLAYCIFLHADSVFPPDFAENPNETWCQYAVVCISPTLKVGVSFEKDHFHVFFVFGSTGCGSSQDLLQLMQRVRVPPLLILYRIRVRGGGGSMSEWSSKEVDEMLGAFAVPRAIDRTVLPPIRAHDPNYAWLLEEVGSFLARDDANFLNNVRTALRKRQITLELGGVDESQPLLFLQDPLPKDADLSGPNLAQERMDRILDAVDLTAHELDALYKKREKLTPTEKAQLERHLIRKTYAKDGPCSFEQLVELHVKKKFAEKQRKAAAVLSPEPHVAAGMDEALLRNGKKGKQVWLKERQKARALIETLPDATADMLTRKQKYMLTRERISLEQDAILQRQEKLLPNKRHRSTDKDPVKRIVGNVNHILRTMALPTLKPSRYSYPGGDTIISEWTLDGGTAAPVLFYAGLDLQPEAVATVVSFVNPMHHMNHVIEDPATRKKYPVNHEHVCSMIVQQAQLQQPTFLHALRTEAKLERQEVPIIFMPLGDLIRICFPPQLNQHVRIVLSVLKVREEKCSRNNRCVSLIRVGREEKWSILVDESNY